MKTTLNLSSAFLLLALLGLCHPPACALGGISVNVPVYYSTFSNPLNNPVGNSIYWVLYNSVVVPGDIYNQPPGEMNAFFYIPFDNATTTLGPLVFYENDMTPDNFGFVCSAEGGGASPVCSPDPVSPLQTPYGSYYLDCYATDSSLEHCACTLPSLNPGEGGILNNAFGNAAVANLTGSAPGGYLGLPSNTSWNMVSPMETSLTYPFSAFEAIYGGSPSSLAPNNNVYLATFNGTFTLFKLPAGGSSWETHCGPGCWTSAAEPTISLGQAIFVKVDPAPQFAPLAAAPLSCPIGDQILVTFNQDVDPSSATNKADFTVTGPGNVNIPVTAAAPYTSSGGYTVVPSSPLVLLTLGSSLASGSTYSVTMNDVSDLAGDSTLSGSAVTFVAGTTPRLLAAARDFDSSDIVVTFDRPMDPVTGGTPANYALTANRGTPPSITAATPLGPAMPPSLHGDSVRLSVSPSLSPNTLYTVSVTGVESACGATVSAGANASFVAAINNPVLSAQLSGANLLLSWPDTNFGLQQTLSLDPPATWQDSSATTSTNNGIVSASIPIGPGATFFRLSLLP